jgi:hypothetical protein
LICLQKWIFHWNIKNSLAHPKSQTKSLKETKKEETPNPANTKTPNPGAEERNFLISKKKMVQ